MTQDKIEWDDSSVGYWKAMSGGKEVAVIFDRTDEEDFKWFCGPKSGWARTLNEAKAACEAVYKEQEK